MGVASSSASNGKRRKRKKKLPKSSSGPPHRQGWRRPCALQRQVPTVQRVAGASDSVHLRLLDIPVVQQRQVRGSMVQKTVVVPQLQSIEGRRHSFRKAEADPHGPDCSADRRDSAVAVHFSGRCACCAGHADSQVPPWRRQLCSHSSSLRNRRVLYTTTGALWFRLQKTADFPQLQFTKVVDFPVVTPRLVPMVLTVQQTIGTLQLPVDKVVDAPVLQGVKVVDIPVVTQRLIHMVSLMMEIHQFVFDKVIDVPLCTSCLPCPLL